MGFATIAEVNLTCDSTIVPVERVIPSTHTENYGIYPRRGVRADYGIRGVYHNRNGESLRIGSIEVLDPNATPTVTIRRELVIIKCLWYITTYYADIKNASYWVWSFTPDGGRTWGTYKEMVGRLTPNPGYIIHLDVSGVQGRHGARCTAYNRSSGCRVDSAIAWDDGTYSDGTSPIAPEITIGFETVETTETTRTEQQIISAT